MEDQYEVPVDFGDQQNPPGKVTTATTSSSVASSSRVASAASAPVKLGSRRNNLAGLRSSFGELQQNKIEGPGSGTATPGGNSFHSSPLVWNSDTPKRIKSRRELEQKIRHRKQYRASAVFPQKFDAPGKSDPNKDEVPGQLPLPKALTDLLLQTAMLGIDTTAKLSKPTLELTRTTLLPQLILPLLQEVWEQYAPDRLQTWMKVVPTSLKNVGNLLLDTEAGQALGEKAGQLGENVVDMASSEVARQCWIDATVALIKLMESLHTPEVKALLGQFAVGACRFVDVLSSGKAKQVWFDAADALWALIEVGSDPVMVMSLAEGCAQICFALEDEREKLKRRRSKGEPAGGISSSEKMQKVLAANRRRERDRRQKGTYPPGKAVLKEGDGREAFNEALLNGLDGYINNPEENAGNFEDQVDEDVDYAAKDDGPPQRVIVPTTSSENIEGNLPNQADTPFPEVISDDDNKFGEEVHDDSESEITTEIEDLQVIREPIDYDEVQTQSSASEKPSHKQNNELAYEQGGKVDYTESLQDQMDQLEWRPNDDGTASEMYDAFDEPILQFYRRLNEVLVETRKQDKSGMQYPSQGEKRSREADNIDIGENSTPDTVTDKGVKSTKPSPLASKGLFGVTKKWWRLIIVAIICGVSSMCMLWFALGCYGFYVLVMGSGRQVYSHPSHIGGLQQPSNIVIQLVAANGDKETGSGRNPRVTSISLDDWNELNKAIEQTLGDGSEL